MTDQFYIDYYKALKAIDEIKEWCKEPGVNGELEYSLLWNSCVLKFDINGQRKEMHFNLLNAPDAMDVIRRRY